MITQKFHDAEQMPDGRWCFTKADGSKIYAAGPVAEKAAADLRREKDYLSQVVEDAFDQDVQRVKNVSIDVKATLAAGKDPLEEWMKAAHTTATTDALMDKEGV